MTNNSKPKLANKFYYIGVGALLLCIITSIMLLPLPFSPDNDSNLIARTLISAGLFLFFIFILFVIGVITLVIFRKKLLNEVSKPINKRWLFFSAMGAGFIVLLILRVIKGLILEPTAAKIITAPLALFLFPILLYLTGLVTIWLYKKLFGKENK